MGRHAWGAAALLTLALGLGSTACGSEKSTPKESSSELTACRAKWHDVADSVVGLDQDTDPSALATRWTSVVATIQYYENTNTAANCQANVDAQVRAIDLLREFSDKVRPYDMTYQVTKVSAAVDLYVHDTLPAPTKDAKGKLVRPPTKAAVTTAMQALTEGAAAANTELQPGWGQLASVELTDETAVTSALQDLDFLAQDSPTWVRCEAALQVIMAAVHAQEGGA